MNEVEEWGAAGHRNHCSYSGKVSHKRNRRCNQRSRRSANCLCDVEKLSERTDQLAG